MMEAAIPILCGIFVCASILAVVPTVHIAAQQHRLRRPRETLLDDFKLRGFAAIIEPALQHAIPDVVEELDSRLIVAGRPWNGISGLEYLALGVVGIIAVGVIALPVGYLSGGLRLAAGLSVVLMTLTGYVWSIAITNIIQRREASSWKEFPFFLDSLVMTMEAGATLPQAIAIYISSNPEAALARDMSDAMNRAAAGADILRAIEETLDRVTVEEIATTMKAIIQAERQGAERMRLLRETAGDVRSKRWEAAEEAAEALKAKLTLPTMLVMLAVFILVMAPALLQVGKSGLF